jgi:hypothetical protein
MEIRDIFSLKPKEDLMMVILKVLQLLNKIKINTIFNMVVRIFNKNRLKIQP